MFPSSINRLFDPLRKLMPRSIKQRAKQILGMPSRRLHHDWAIAQLARPDSDEHVIVDVGARNGWFFQCWKDWCPDAMVFAFEPHQSAYQRLRDKWGNDTSIILSEKGLGDVPGQHTFRVLKESEVSSSFLDPDPVTWAEVDYQTGEVEHDQVEIVTLDGYLKDLGLSEIHLIKLDIQGFELRALRGAVESLRRTRFVLVESSIRPMYIDGSGFTEVHDFLRDQGFHLMDLRAWHRGNHVLMEADMLFRRDDLAPAVDPQSNRTYATALDART